MFPRERRLRAGRDWDALFSGGFSVAGSLLSLRILPRRDARRIGFSVGKKVGGAVARNLLKRRLRAIAAQHWDEFPIADIGVLARPAAGRADFEELGAAMRELAERAARRAVPGAP